MNSREIDYSRQYQWWHDDSDSHFESMARADATWLTQFLPVDKNCRILDIGCGMGFSLAGMLRAGYANVEGIDSDVAQVTKARARGLAATHVRVSDTHTWMTARPANYELITAVDVLEHIPPPEHLNFLADVLTSLADGGTFVCRVPNGNSSISGRYRYIDWTHLTSFTEHSLDFVLYNAGFKDIVVEDADPFRWLSGNLLSPAHVLRGLFRSFRRLEMMAELGRVAGGRVPLSPNILAVAHKTSG